MPFDLVVLSEPGLGDAYFTGEVERDDGFFANFADEVFEASPSLEDKRVALIDQGDGRYVYTVDWMGDEGSVTYRAFSLGSGGVAIDEEPLFIEDGNAIPGSQNNPDLAGPPYTTEAGRIHSSAVLRGVRLANTPEIEGTIPAGSAPAMLGRVVNAGGQAINASSIAGVAYSIFELSESDPDVETPISSHQGVVLQPGDVFFSTLQTDYQWGNTDSIGYNFRLIPDVLSRGQAFPTARRHYRVRIDVTPIAGQPFQIRFRPWAI